MQVGDKLSVNTAQVAKALAVRLAATTWTCPEDANAMMCALLPMSKNIQQLLLYESLRLAESRESTMFSWPMPLQQVRRCQRDDTMYRNALLQTVFHRLPRQSRPAPTFSHAFQCNLVPR